VQDTGDRLFDRYLGIETVRPVWQQEIEFGADAGLHYQPSNWMNLVLIRQVLEVAVEQVESARRPLRRHRLDRTPSSSWTRTARPLTATPWRRPSAALVTIEPKVRIATAHVNPCGHGGGEAHATASAHLLAMPRRRPTS
jgi:hypothetical protein